MATIDPEHDQASSTLVERLTRDLVRGAVAEIEAINQALEEHLRTARAIAAERKERLDEATEALSRSQKRVDELENELGTMGNVVELERANRELEESLARTEAKGQDLTRANAELEASLRDALDRVAQRETEGGAAARNLELAGTKIADMSARISDLETRLKTAQDDARDRDERLRASQVVVSQLGQSTTDLRSELGEARQAAMDAVDFIAELEGQNAELREQSDETTAALIEAERQRAAADEQRQGLNDIIEMLRRELDEAHATASELGRRVDDADRTIDRLHLDVQDAHRARETVASEAASAMEAVRRRLHDAEAEIDESSTSARHEARRLEPIGSSQLVAALGNENTALVLDGDALARLALPDSEVDARRNQLITSLGELIADTPAFVEVVFDASVSPTLAVEHTISRVGVRVSPPEVPIGRSLAQAADGIPYGCIVYLAHAEEAAPSPRRRTEPIGLTAVLGALGGELVMHAAARTADERGAEAPAADSDAPTPGWEPADEPAGHQAQHRVDATVGAGADHDADGHVDGDVDDEGRRWWRGAKA